MTLFVAPSVARGQVALTDVTYALLAPTAPDLPPYLAQAQGFFKDEGLNVEIVEAGSPVNVTNLGASVGGNVIDNGCDSIIAAVSHKLPLKIIATLFNVMPYSLVVGPGIKSWADLKGKSIMLGTKQDVSAIAFNSLAAPQKLTLDDFQVVLGGNTNARYAALLSGNIQGTILAQPYDLMAVSKGASILGSANDTLKNYAFTCLVVNTDWAAKNRVTVVKLLRAIRRAVQYGYTNKAAALSLFEGKMKIAPAFAERAWDLYFSKWKAWDPNLKPALTGLETVGRYQVQYGVIPSMPPMNDLYDPSFLAEAAK